MRQRSDDKSAEVALLSANKLISWEVERSGVTRRVARTLIARAAGVAPGTIENLLAGRLKFAERVAERLNGVLVETIQRKITDLEHELAMARLAGLRHYPVDIARAEMAIEEAKRALGKG